MVVKAKERSIRQKQANKSSLLIISAVILGGLVLFAGFVAYFTHRGNVRTEQAKTAVLARAKEECLKSGKKVDVCESLVAKSSSPDWGPDWWTVDVSSTNDATFTASARVDFKEGKPRILDYSVNQ